MKTFQTWPAVVLLGSSVELSPYHTASARPGPPALSQGKTLTASPVVPEPSLTWTGGVQLVQPLAALAALTNTWRLVGVLLRLTQTTKRFCAESIEATTKLAASPLSLTTFVDATVIKPEPAPVPAGHVLLTASSRKHRLPLAVAVPMLSLIVPPL